MKYIFKTNLQESENRLYDLNFSSLSRLELSNSSSKLVVNKNEDNVKILLKEEGKDTLLNLNMNSNSYLKMKVYYDNKSYDINFSLTEVDMKVDFPNKIDVEYKINDELRIINIYKEEVNGN